MPRALIAFTLLALPGCQKYVELHNTAERIWIMSQDQTLVFRCYDTVPPGQFLSQTNAAVVCKQARMVGPD